MMRILMLAQLVWDQFESLLWPVQCCGCGRWDWVICEDCSRQSCGPTLLSVLDDHQGVPTWPVVALGSYDGSLRSVILAAKHDQGRDLSRFLFESGVALGRSSLEFVDYAGVSQVWVVPAPSSRRRSRRRTTVVPRIAEGVRAGLSALIRASPDHADIPVAVTVVHAVSLVPQRPLRWVLSMLPPWLSDLLEWIGAPVDDGQAGRGSRQRGLGRAGSMMLDQEVPSGTAVVIVDDVCASGATLRECARVLGDQVMGIAVVAVAP